MKKLLTLLLLAFLTLPALAQGSWTSVFINGKKYNGPATYELDTMYVPLQAYADALGLKVHSQDDNYCLTDPWTGDRECPIKAGKSGLWVNGVSVPDALVAKDNGVYVNAKTLTNVLGGRYQADPSIGQITIFLTPGPHRPRVAGNWAIYVDGRVYDGFAQGEGETMTVRAHDLAQALGVSESEDGGKVQLNGADIEGATPSDKGVLIPLAASAKAIGCSVKLSDKRIDLHTTRGMVPPAAQKAILNVPEITSPLEMNFLYGIVLDEFENEGLKLYHPVVTNWCTLKQLQAKEGADAYGYATCSTYSYSGVGGGPAGVEDLQIFIPYGLSPEKTLHSLAHELGHCWQYDNGLLDAKGIYTEGFAEWVASRVLEHLKLTHEIANMKINLYDEYREGFKYFQSYETEHGFQGCLDEMKRRARQQ